MDTNRTITAQIPIHLAEQIDQLAVQMDRSRSWIVKQALAEWAEIEHRRHLMTLEGLEDIKQGRVISDEAVGQWLDSLDSDNPLPLPQPCN